MSVCGHCGASGGRLTRSGVQEQSSRKGQFLKVEMRWSLRYNCQIEGSAGAPMIAPPQPQDGPERDSKPAGGCEPQSMPGAPRPQSAPAAFWEQARKAAPRRPRLLKKSRLLGMDGARRAGKVPPHERGLLGVEGAGHAGSCVLCVGARCSVLFCLESTAATQLLPRGCGEWPRVADCPGAPR